MRIVPRPSLTKNRFRLLPILMVVAVGAVAIALGATMFGNHYLRRVESNAVAPQRIGLRRWPHHHYSRHDDWLSRVGCDINPLTGRRGQGERQAARCRATGGDPR